VKLTIDVNTVGTFNPFANKNLNPLGICTQQCVHTTFTKFSQYFRQRLRSKLYIKEDFQKLPTN